MAIISGVNIPDDKRVEVSLQRVHGIGLSQAKDIIGKAGISENPHVRDLTEADLTRIREIVDREKTVEGQGNTISWGSAGTSGFTGSRKATAFAAQRATEVAARKAADQGLRQVEAFVRGPGAGREAAIRTLQSSGVRVTSIRDVTPIPHNGCRPPKRRRV